MSSALSHKNVHVLSHPLLSHGLSVLRSKATPQSEFRRVLAELSRFIAYESSRDLALKAEPIETPFEKTEGFFISEGLTMVSILRSGMGMLDGFLQIFPEANVGHIGIYRDKFLHNTVEYYFRVPDDSHNNKVFLLDPLLATGSTVAAAVRRLKQYGFRHIRLNCILASEQGIDLLHHEHPDVDIYCLSIERALGDLGYLLPGLGDAGDRLYGTRRI